MKRKILLAALLCSLLLTLVAGCNAAEASADESIKSISRPYIAQYECTKAILGEKDLLEKYEYIRIILVDKEKLEVCIKPKNSSKHTFEGKYAVDAETRELNGEIGILGFRFKEKVIVQNGKFEIRKIFLGKLLFVKFEII